MNAIQFIQQNGVEKAREELNKLPNSNVTHMTSDARMLIDENNPMLDEFQRSQIRDLMCIKELKHLVEIVDLINSIGGIKFAKSFIAATGSTMGSTLEQAIADYESIYSNDMGDDSHIENHISPNCKVK